MLYKQKLLFWMRLIAINRLTALISLYNSLQLYKEHHLNNNNQTNSALKSGPPFTAIIQLGMFNITLNISVWKKNIVYI